MKTWGITLLLTAALCGSRAQAATNDRGLFGQGGYEQPNLFGRGYTFDAHGQWLNRRNFGLDLAFANPRVFDSEWGFKVDGFFLTDTSPLPGNPDLSRQRYGMGLTVGRKLTEKVASSLGYRLEKNRLRSAAPLPFGLKPDEYLWTLLYDINRQDLDDPVDPTQGSQGAFDQQLAGGFPLANPYMESTLDGSYYWPLTFGENFVSNFRIRGLFSWVYPIGGKDVPLTERFRLGGYGDLRGYPFESLGPNGLIGTLASNAVPPQTATGNREFVLQGEYYVPLIPEVRLKALVFTDVGRVYGNGQPFVLNDLRKDVGMGLRWITPVVPLRFEWAYPIEHGRAGVPQAIFYLGY